MKQDKSRKDFFLDEDYESYRAFHAFKSFLLEELKADEATKNKLLVLVDKVQDRAYSAGYSNAEFDQAEREE